MGEYTVSSIEEKRIMDYTRLSLNDVWKLDFITYRALLRDAVIFDNMQSEEGRDYLFDCWRMEQTKPDRERLRKKFGKEGDFNK